MSRIKCLILILFIKISICFSPAPAQSMEQLQEILGDEVMSYMLNISGTVMNESFHNAQAIMTLSVAGAEQTDPFKIDIVGFPQRNDRNRFIWFSQDSYMTYFPNTIRCDVKYSYMHEPINIHFYYASPDLYTRTPEGFFTPSQEEEVARLAEKVLEPTRINAQAGKLEVYISGNRVSGRVWIKGYDNVEEAYVQYTASFTGRTIYGMDPRHPVPEPQPMHILEQTDERYR